MLAYPRYVSAVRRSPHRYVFVHSPSLRICACLQRLLRRRTLGRKTITNESLQRVATLRESVRGIKSRSRHNTLYTQNDEPSILLQ